jgi:hypothetical protein
MRIFARKSGRCAYPPIGSYITNVPFKKKFGDLELRRIDPSELPQLRPDGSRQPQSEASVLGRIVVIRQGRAGFPDIDIESGRG